MEDVKNPSLEENEDVQTDRYLIFLLDKEKFGIDIRNVSEIVKMQEIISLPDVPAYIKGIINLRGNIVPLVDARLRFNMTSRDYDDRTCIIVIEYEGTITGLIVDSVSEVQTIPDDDIETMPKVNENAGDRYVANVGKVGSDVVLLLNCKQLFFAVGNDTY